MLVNQKILSCVPSFQLIAQLLPSNLRNESTLVHQGQTNKSILVNVLQTWDELYWNLSLGTTLERFSGQTIDAPSLLSVSFGCLMLCFCCFQEAR